MPDPCDGGTNCPGGLTVGTSKKDTEPRLVPFSGPPGAVHGPWTRPEEPTQAASKVRRKTTRAAKRLIALRATTQPFALVQPLPRGEGAHQGHGRRDIRPRRPSDPVAQLTAVDPPRGRERRGRREHGAYGVKI